MYKLDGARSKREFDDLGTYCYWIAYVGFGVWMQFAHVAARRTAWSIKKNTSVAAGLIWPVSLTASLLRGTAEERERRVRFFLRSRIYGPQELLFLKSGFLAQKSEEPSNYDQIRRSVRNRDNYTCQVCGLDGSTGDEVSLHVDHIVPRRWGGSHRPENLRTLCKYCHEARHAKVMDY